MHHQAGQQKEKTFLVGEAIVEKVKKKSYCFQNKGGFLFFAALHKTETLHFEIEICRNLQEQNKLIATNKAEGNTLPVRLG